MAYRLGYQVTAFTGGTQAADAEKYMHKKTLQYAGLKKM